MTNIVLTHEEKLEKRRNEINSFTTAQEHRELAMAFFNRLVEVVSIPLDVWCVERDDTGYEVEGKISFYWDTNGFYADMEMDEETKSFSFFSRDRPNDVEGWIEQVFLKDLTDEWFFTNMKPLIV